MSSQSSIASRNTLSGPTPHSDASLGSGSALATTVTLFDAPFPTPSRVNSYGIVAFVRESPPIAETPFVVTDPTTYHGSTLYVMFVPLWLPFVTDVM